MVGWSDLLAITPEIMLGIVIVLLLVGDLVIPHSGLKRRRLTPVAVLGILFVGVLVGTSQSEGIFFSGQLAADPLAKMFKLLFLATAMVGVALSAWSAELPDRHMGEYYALLLSITLGMFLMASANDFLLAYLAIEFVSIVSYAMAGYRLRDKRSSEAALKYVVYGGAASGLMLFGISLFYGMFGTTEFTEGYRALQAYLSAEALDAAAGGARAFPTTLMTSVMLMFAGVGFKIAVVPFHMWSPDVYEGAPTPFTAFLSVGPKAAGFVLLIRIMVGILAAPGTGGFDLDASGFLVLAGDLPIPAALGAVAALSMTVGNLAALTQRNVKRLLAYSSIAHAGYLLMGFVVLSQSALEAVVFYLCLYYLMNIGAFAVAQAVRDRSGGNEDISAFSGLGSREPILALAMTIFLLSLTGLPPLAGFIGKFYLFSAVLERGGTGYVLLAVIGILNSAVSLYYYMSVAKAMWITPAEDESSLGVAPRFTVLAGILAVPTFVLGLYWAPVSNAVAGGLSMVRSGDDVQVLSHVHVPAPR
jgi:NADH-quinone oxidoreductase subunit N